MPFEGFYSLFVQQIEEINPESGDKLHEALSSYAGSASAIIDPTRVKQVSWKPRAIVYQGFLADLECDHLISIAISQLKGSAVASKLSEVRATSGMFFSKNKKTQIICSNFRGNQLSGYNYILEISRNTLLNLRFVAGALVLTGSHLFVHVLFPVIRVLRWGKTNTMDTLRRKTSTTMKIGSTLSLLGSIPIEGDQKHQHTEYGHLSPQ
ncbi:Oxoglutarate/iron-dependent oxygenase [Trifolium repens]|nr:Oxoglutarate/iron-dependent oxygenase [Trifolium repens]